MALKSASTATLVTLVKLAKDEQAFEELMVRHRDYLCRFLLSAGLDHQHLDDVFQETCVKVFLRIEQFTEQSKFSTWLSRIGYNEMLMFYRKQSIYQKLKDALSSRPRASINEDQITQLMDVEKGLTALTSAEKRVFWHCRVLGYSHSETSKILSMPLGSVKSYAKSSISKIPNN